jgi:hypothetical protein
VPSGVHIAVSSQPAASRLDERDGDMPTFVFTYRAPKGYVRTPETGLAWRAWFDGMVNSVVDLGQPAISPTIVGNCSSETTELGGYSLIAADDLQGALAAARGCPYLTQDGGVEIAELIPVPATAAGA